MSSAVKWSLGGLLALLIAVGGSWWWGEYMERYVAAEPYFSEAKRLNPMLAATRLLRAQGRDVSSARTLVDVRLAELPDGVLLAPDSAGIVTTQQADLLDAWVRRGNVLVTTPRWLGKGEIAFVNDESVPAESLIKNRKKNKHDGEDGDSDEEQEEDDEEAQDMPPVADDSVETDPIAFRLGVRRTHALARTERCVAGAAPLPTVMNDKDKENSKDQTIQRSERLTCVPLPGQEGIVEVDGQSVILATMSNVAKGDTGPPAGEALRDYRLGKGHVVMLAANYFDNDTLREFDHGELLLALAKLQPRGKVLIVERFGVTPWKTALWHHFAFALVAAAVALLLALWMALRRFGPLLAGPREERRSLMEHIAASGAWLWKSQPGRDMLLAAVRKQVMSLVKRRLPALDGMAREQQTAMLARLSALPADALDAALHAPAGQHPQEFTRQIRTLQELRKEYER